MDHVSKSTDSGVTRRALRLQGRGRGEHKSPNKETANKDRMRDGDKAGPQKKKWGPGLMKGEKKDEGKGGKS